MKNLFLMFGLTLAVGAASLVAADKVDSTTVPTACTNAVSTLCTNAVPLACTNGVPIACTNGVFQFSSIDLTRCTNCLAAN
jgi:hypothetical protein